MPNIPLALILGHPGAQSDEELKRNILETTVERIINNLTRPLENASDTQEPAPLDIIFKGGFDAINHFFCEHELSDGLPIVPPTREKVETFLRFTDYRPDEVLGIIPPDNRAATVWSIAVNGVMAGCRPEYMPVLIALVEAMAEPLYGVEHSGNTPGGDTLIILNGPIIKQLHFNYGQGVLRDGFLPNTSVGRFWRLYLRNVAGFLLQKTDKVTHGTTWRVVLSENEDVLQKIAWEPNSVEMGFSAGDNTVCIARYIGGTAISGVSGDTPEEMLPYLADAMWKAASWKLTFVVGNGSGTMRPLLVLSPVIAETIAKAGWSKHDVKRYLFDHARIAADDFERTLRDWIQRPIWNLAHEVREGHIPKLFHESDDPKRMVPIVWKPEDFMIAVSGDPLRNNAYVFTHNGYLGYPVAKKISLPSHWEQLLATAKP